MHITKALADIVLRWLYLNEHVFLITWIDIYLQNNHKA
ncbi:hypothetical protein C3B55_00915 [Candidatus Pseudomonas adelgestsugas]|uniref:Uncharacterized protein n=1 Tax=Candidatus Pseudomonas adelgestsugas TaxID=1302376 RepID=A0ABX5RAI5_9PSED|nr:hypothetical protein C3B55_00915 [Candidatus Pseudomonas adelgestsugas]